MFLDQIEDDAIELLISCLNLFVIEKRKAVLLCLYPLPPHGSELYPPPIRPLSNFQMVTDGPRLSQRVWNVSELEPSRALE